MSASSEVWFAALHALVEACQVIAGLIDDPAAPLEVRSIAALFRNVPPSESRIENLAVERQASLFAKQLAARLHQRVHGHAADARCAFSPASYPFEIDDGRYACGPDLEAAFARWLATVLGALRTTRPRRVGARALRTLEERRTIPKAGDLAREFGCSAELLRRRFVEETGESFVSYRTRARVVVAIRLLSTTTWKVEAIARDVGWLSKKDLYAHLKRATGLTPGQVRRTPADARDALIASLCVGRLDDVSPPS
jgi:AraC-like DNA-binding protein